jgi:hypothetical protein
MLTAIAEYNKIFSVFKKAQLEFDICMQGRQKVVVK